MTGGQGEGSGEIRMRRSMGIEGAERPLLDSFHLDMPRDKTLHQQMSEQRPPR